MPYIFRADAFHYIGEGIGMSYRRYQNEPRKASEQIMFIFGGFRHLGQSGKDKICAAGRQGGRAALRKIKCAASQSIILYIIIIYYNI